ncbi:MAG: 4Fe-4S dicluster domain-containing protein [Anaerolineae bacterium]
MNWITLAQLQEWLTGLMASHTVIAPTRVAADLVLYQPVSAIDRIVFDNPRVPISPKEFFLPATEALMTIERVRQVSAGGDPTWKVKITETHMARDQVLFGLHPCDVHALSVLDALLLKPPVDTYYAERRERTTLIGMACEEMGPACFCTSLGLSPDDGDGMDIVLHRRDDRYLLDARTDKGQALVAGLHLIPAPETVAPRDWTAEFPVPVRDAWQARFDDAQWAQVADRCLNCKICAYVCPTCRCFDIRDEVVAQKPGYQEIERLRCWDACTVDNYRRIAGGHNPRPTKMQRLRNRFYCKFDYYPADFGPVACVGCGRCIDLCPVNVDITEILGMVAARSHAQEVKA